MVKIIEISNSFNQSIRIEGNKLTYKEGKKTTVTTLYSHVTDEEDLILIGGYNSYQVIIDNAPMYSRHVKQALRGLEGDKVVLFSEWAIAKRFRE